jgi:hypothetical protein
MRRPLPAAERASAWFLDVTAETGLNFTHINGMRMTGEFYYPEVIAPGAALFPRRRCLSSHQDPRLPAAWTAIGLWAAQTGPKNSEKEYRGPDHPTREPESQSPADWPLEKCW